MRKKKTGIIAIVIVALLGAGVGAYYLRRGGPEMSVVTSPVTRGDVIDAVAATGTLQAVTTVQVGSQVSGNISWLGADFNSIVKKGQVVAKLDPALFQASVDQSKANLLKATADVGAAQANLDRSSVMVTDAQQKYKRMQELFDQKLETQADLDAAKIALDSANAQVQSSQASLNSSKASVTQSQANLNQAQVSLDHTIILAPVDGIVTQRSVDVGQTVAASMTAPTVFIIAADLTQMQVSANIDEADVGRIRPGQHATFHVDAYPTDTFDGTVVQIRLNPIVVQNVTTYATILNVNNTDLRLKPGMTTNLKVEVWRKPGVLRVPNAAIRFRPSAEIFAALKQPVPPELAAAGRGGRGSRSGRGGQGGGRGGANGAGANAETGQVPAVAPPSGAGAASQAGGSASGQRRGGDPAQRMAQFKAMPPDQQQQFIARLKARGQDTTAFEAALSKPAAGAKPTQAADASSPHYQPKYGAAQSGETIDALFAPLAAVETRGRVWLYADKQLKPVNVRLGITDGTNTELLGNDLQDTAQVVTGVTGGVTAARPAAGAAPANPFQQGRGGGGGRGF